MTLLHRLILLLLIAVDIASGALTPPHSPPRTTGKTPVSGGTRLEIHPPTYYSEHDPGYGVKTVDSYTITDPRPPGESISSENHKQKLFVDPIKHKPRSAASRQEVLKLADSYYRRWAMTSDTYVKERQHMASSEAALDKISAGHVVRHTNEEKTVLLHHNKMTAEQAKLHHKHDFVWDLTHTPTGYSLRPSKAKLAHQTDGTVPEALSQSEEEAMHARLSKHMQEAQQYKEGTTTAKNKDKKVAELNEISEAQRAALKEFRRKNKAKVAASTSASTSSPPMKRVKLGTSTVNLNRQRSTTKGDGNSAANQ
jgi:hypothetical protein